METKLEFTWGLRKGKVVRRDNNSVVISVEGIGEKDVVTSAQIEEMVRAGLSRLSDVKFVEPKPAPTEEA